MADFFSKGQIMEGWEHPASELGVCIGQVQCPTCDTIVHGAIRHTCAFCDTPLFPVLSEVINRLMQLKTKCPEIEECIKLLEGT